MKVMLLTGRATGGIGRHVGTLAAGLRHEGVDVEVVTDPSTARAFGWPDAHAWWPVRPPRRAVSAAADWHRMMRLAGRVDVVHAHGSQAALVALPVVLRARPRPAFVVTLHNALPPRAHALMRRLLALAVRQADLVTGASADLTELASGLGARRVRTIPVASPVVGALLHQPRPDAAHRVSLREIRWRAVGLTGDPRRPLVLTLARAARQKDLPTLVAAAERCTRDATWLVIGGGDLDVLSDLRARAAPAGRVQFLDRTDDVAGWLAVADVFALSSTWEARPLVVQEAMAAGVPVVATEVGGIGSLVATDDGDVATLVRPADPDELARAVARLIGDRAYADALAVRARLVAARWTGTGTEARQWVEIYRGLRGA